MSWQAYVDQLTGQGLVAASLHGLNGQKWAGSANSASDAEAAAIASALSTGSTNQQKIAGTSYITLRNTAEAFYGKQGAGGFVAAKSNTAVVIGVYNEKLQPGQANKIVEGIADYLRNSGY